MSGITIPDMIKIAESHSLKVIPLDLDIISMNVCSKELEACLSPDTKLIIIAHLFGAIISMDTVFKAVKNHPNVKVIEDCAQSFTEFSNYLCDHRSDLAFFSFGAIKTKTAFGGGILLVKNRTLRRKLKQIQAEYPRVTRSAFLIRFLRYFLLRLILTNYGICFFRKLCQIRRLDYDAVINANVKGFLGGDLFAKIRQQPSIVQTNLLRHCLKKSESQRLDKRRHLGRALTNALDDKILIAGGNNHKNSYWLFTISTPMKATLIAILRDSGVDATTNTTSIIALKGAPRAEEFMRNALLIPLDLAMSQIKIKEIAEYTRKTNNRRDEGTHNLAVFDFDDTLTNSDSFSAFGSYTAAHHDL